MRTEDQVKNDKIDIRVVKRGKSAVVEEEAVDDAE
jgi:hypothetical protein